MKDRYENLDGFRALAAIGIILMHVRANGNYEITGYIYDKVLASFTNLTFLFMLLSSFSMCCGYYDKIKNNTLSIEQFYKRRYDRIWPYFALLCSIELIVNHNLNSFYEWVADLTLAFGLLPNAKISVVGVGWFIGLIFVFYMIFPFFTFLIGNKRRAWFVLVVTIVMNVLCKVYFFDDSHILNDYRERSNIIFSAMFFVAGGLIYIYLDIIKKIKKSWLVGITVLITILLYYVINDSEYVLLVLFSMLAIYGICSEGHFTRFLFQNKVIKFLAKISMELYLGHMFVFRFIEKFRLLHLTEFEVLNYIIVSLFTILGTVLMAFSLRKALDFVVNAFLSAKKTPAS